MPEGPEVYVMSKRLRSRFPAGHTLKQVLAINERYKKGRDAIPEQFSSDLPMKVTDITSKGKKTIVKLSKGWGLLISYGMSGHWEKERGKHSQLKFTFANPAGLTTRYYWVSARSLPTCVVQFLKHDTLQAEVDKLGYDIIRDDPDADEVIAAYGKSRKNICAFIMEQKPFCGIGNYVKAVVLYRCGISPHRKVHELTDEEKWLIWDTAQQVAREAIAARGMGIRDYKDEDGNVVGVSFDITPYNMSEDAEGREVISEDIAGRTTWWVPQVQY